MITNIWRQWNRAQRFLSCNLLLAIVVQRLCFLLAATFATSHTQYLVDANNLYDSRQQPQQTYQQNAPPSQYYATPYQTTGRRYHNEYQKHPYSESKQQQQQSLGNNNMYDGDDDIDVVAAELPQQQLHQQQQYNARTRGAGSVTLTEQNSHKCRIWVPVEAMRKYAAARNISIDQTKHLNQIEVCCPGFGAVRWRGNTVCRPICENCQNGFCIAPEHCQCFEGFVSNDNGDCIFTCPLGCLNGRCYLDGSCECDPGFKLDETRTFCRPICSAGCDVNAGQNCTEPEVCGCARGFQLKARGCERICEPDCGIGGNCLENNTCKCTQGYILKDNTCQSDCYQTCENGICAGRNRCICNSGFRYHERSTMCIPT